MYLNGAKFTNSTLNQIKISGIGLDLVWLRVGIKNNVKKKMVNFTYKGCLVGYHKQLITQATVQFWQALSSTYVPYMVSTLWPNLVWVLRISTALPCSIPSILRNSLCLIILMCLRTAMQSKPNSVAISLEHFIFSYSLSILALSETVSLQV